MAIEKWVAAASLGMFIMFVAELASISIFLKHPSYDIDPSSQMREFISISAAPALILTGSSFLLARRYGSRLCGSLIIAGGIVTIAGMYYITTKLVPNIPPVYLVSELSITPILFMAISIPVIIIGCLLFKSKPKPKRDYFFDR
ncbi:Uncharacterised protein [uncultured archaeon]|nr:Uncharacterised protein [uncultured archaeon]